MSETRDDEWLGARERGERVDHVPAETRAKYDQLQHLIEALPGETPKAGWKQRVLDALDNPVVVPVRPASPPRRARWWAFSGALAAAAVLLVVLIQPPSPRETFEPMVATEVRAGPSPHRGGQVSIGDTLIVRAESRGPAELRVYGERGEPLARCAAVGGARCVFERDGERHRYRIEIELRARGVVRSVLFIGASVGVPGASLDEDLSAAARAKIETVSAPPVLVQ